MHLKTAVHIALSLMKSANCFCWRRPKLLVLPLLLLLLAMLCRVAPASAAPANDTWLLIDYATATISVMKGDVAIARFDDAAFGRLGTKPVHYKDDTSTPLGEFRIDGINGSSHYTLFFSLNYPTHQHAKLAMQAGKLNIEDYLAIFNAEMEGRRPPYTTPLGGMIGIHGLGAAPLDMHRKFNWTRGCVALDNQQIRALSRYIRVGMRVLIQ
jgi:hypothetical protein